MFVLLEIFLTTTETMQPLTGEVDKQLGFIYSPDTKFTMFNEGFSLGRINNHGLIGKDCNKKKTNNTFRIALLGDSYVQGIQLFEKEHFATILENKLNNKGNKKIEVLNFGVSGHNLSDMYCYYQNKVKEFKPDLVLFFICENDLKDKNIQIKKTELYPYAEIINDSLTINYDFTKNRKYKIYDNTKYLFSLSFGRLLNKIYINIKTKQTFSILFDKFYEIFKTNTKQTSQKEIINLTRTSKLILLEFKKENSIIVYRDTINQSIDKIIRNEIAIPIINLNDTLNYLRDNNINPNYWKVTKKNGHWNHIGHKTIGEFINNRLDIEK